MGKTHYKLRSLRIFLSSWRKHKAMRKRDVIDSRSISPVASNLLSNPEHHSASSLCIQDGFCENSTVHHIWRIKMSRRAMVALRIFTTKKKCFSKRGNVSRVRKESEPGDFSTAVRRNLRSASDQEEAVALITTMKVVIQKWTAGIVKRFERN